MYISRRVSIMGGICLATLSTRARQPRFFSMEGPCVLLCMCTVYAVVDSLV